MAELEARNASYQQLKRLYNQTEKPDFQNLNVPQLLVREAHSENAWNRFAANSLRLIPMAVDDEEANAHRTMMDTGEQIYLQIRERIKMRMAEINEQTRQRANVPDHGQINEQNQEQINENPSEQSVDEDNASRQ